MLERSEWKAFKEMVAPVKSLRKCGKKLPRYCDSNKDKEISTTEWLDCLNVQGTYYNFPFSSQKIIYIFSFSGNIPKTPRTGKMNPLNYLKDD